MDAFQEKIKNTITGIFLEVGDFLREAFGKNKVIKTKSDGSLVTEIDISVEEKIIKSISKEFPSHSFLGEENTSLKSEKAEYMWVIDPIDGTNNFVKGIPYFCISIALKKNDEYLCGYIYNPMNKDLYQAYKGEGAFKNKEKLFILEEDNLKNSLIIYTAVKKLVKEREGEFIPFLKNLHIASLSMRRYGSTALEICEVAESVFQGFVGFGPKEWDTAAANLILLEAGGVSYNFSGKKYTPGLDIDIIAGNHVITKKILDLYNLK